jgi:hypothetical protein
MTSRAGCRAETAKAPPPLLQPESPLLGWQLSLPAVPPEINRCRGPPKTSIALAKVSVTLHHPKPSGGTLQKQAPHRLSFGFWRGEEVVFFSLTVSPCSSASPKLVLLPQPYHVHLGGLFLFDFSCWRRDPGTLNKSRTPELRPQPEPASFKLPAIPRGMVTFCTTPLCPPLSCAARLYTLPACYLVFTRLSGDKVSQCFRPGSCKNKKTQSTRATMPEVQLHPREAARRFLYVKR